MKKLSLCLVFVLASATSCGGPLPTPPECEPGTRPAGVCFHPNKATTCDKGDGLTKVSGCTVEINGLDYLCVPECS